MTPRRERAAPRWQDRELDEAALAAARRVRAAVAVLRDRGAERWATWFEALLPALEDGDADSVRAAAERARAAFGARDSVRDAWPDADALALRDEIERVLRTLDRRAAARA